VVEVPHFASLRDGEREISILRSEDGLTWNRHMQAASDSHKDVQDIIKAVTGGTKFCVNVLLFVTFQPTTFAYSQISHFSSVFRIFSFICLFFTCHQHVAMH